MDKRQLRRDIAARLAQAGAEELARADLSIYAALLALPQFAAAASVMCFASFRGEVNTWPLMEAILTEGKTLSLPRITEHGLMQAQQITDIAALTRQDYDIFAPPAESPLIEPARLDLVIVPGLAFDAAGWRLGRGGGYYDRFLAATPAYKLALCYELQLLPELPHAPHDIRMDAVLTEYRLYAVK